MHKVYIHSTTTCFGPFQVIFRLFRIAQKMRYFDDKVCYIDDISYILTLAFLWRVCVGGYYGWVGSGGVLYRSCSVSITVSSFSFCYTVLRNLLQLWNICTRCTSIIQANSSEIIHNRHAGRTPTSLFTLRIRLRPGIWAQFVLNIVQKFHQQRSGCSRITCGSKHFHEEPPRSLERPLQIPTKSTLSARKPTARVPNNVHTSVRNTKIRGPVGGTHPSYYEILG